MTVNVWGKVRKINGKLAMPILVVGGEGELKQNLRKMDGSSNYILFTQQRNNLPEQAISLEKCHTLTCLLCHMFILYFNLLLITQQCKIVDSTIYKTNLHAPYNKNVKCIDPPCLVKCSGQGGAVKSGNFVMCY
jgi:hypothetical protein